MLITPELSTCNIVFVGNFNPVIFNPDWLLTQEILSQEEYNNSEVGVIHSELSKITFESYIIEVTKNRVVFETNEAPFVRILDLATSIFGGLLPHTPIKQLGINRHIHFPLGRDQLDIIGKTLAPQNVWGEWGDQIEGGSERKIHGGMRSLTMEQRKLDDRDDGYLRVTAQPSNKIKGLYLYTNDHFEIPHPDNAEEAIHLVNTVFENSVRRSEWISDQVLKIVAN